MTEFIDQSKKRSKKEKIGLSCMILLLTVVQVYAGKYLYSVLTVILLLALFLEKQKIIMEDGFLISYSVLGFHHSSLWKWSEITNITLKNRRKQDKIEVYVGKGAVIRPFLLLQKEKEEFLAYIKRKNSKVQIKE